MILRWCQIVMTRIGSLFLLVLCRALACLRAGWQDLTPLFDFARRHLVWQVWPIAVAGAIALCRHCGYRYRPWTCFERSPPTQLSVRIKKNNNEKTPPPPSYLPHSRDSTPTVMFVVFCVAFFMPYWWGGGSGRVGRVELRCCFGKITYLCALVSFCPPPPTQSI